MNNICHFLLELDNDVAENLTAILSPGARLDIEKVLLLSYVYDCDISASKDMLDSAEFINSIDPSLNLASEDVMNPLFLPFNKKAVSNCFEMNDDGKTATFTAMNGNVFAARELRMHIDNENYLKATLLINPFLIPSFEELINTKEYLIN